ncbi:hypothetical protein REPUB_Repub15cG0125700 [Reevesia pubescens]
MGPKWLWVMMSVLVLELARLSNGCLEQERTALLQLKPFFTYYRYSGNWTEEEGSDCCRWESVKCNITTRQVTKLSLRSSMEEEEWYLSEFSTGGSNKKGEERYLNASLFLPFAELRSLVLVGNHIVGCVENEGFGKLSKLRHLEMLDLSYNYFNDSTLSSLTKISSLKSLNLAGNYLTGSNHPEGFGKLSKLRHLEMLDLSYNYFNDSTLSSLTKISSLKSLNLAGNYLTGSNHPEGFGKLSKLRHLEMLDLSYNYFNDSTLSSLTKISSLKSLNLAGNYLTGSNHPEDHFKWLSRLSDLETLDLSDNNLTNNFLLHLGGLSSLRTLILSENKLKGMVHIQEYFYNLTNLKKLDLSYNQIESLGRSTHGNGRQQRLISLEEINLSDNLFNNSVLAHLDLSGLPNLKSLNIGQNQLNGSIDIKELNVLSNVEDLILDNNTLDINFLQSIGILTSLKTLSMYNCGLAGTLPTQGWCDLKSLEELRLNGNALTSAIPSCLGNLTSLRFLDISDNQFTGNVAFTPLINLTMLQFLSLSNNHFQVPVSFKSFANHSDLKFLLSNENELVAEPVGLQTWSPKFQLKIFSLSNCTMEEERKVRLPNFLYYQYDLRYIDLSYNDFWGIKLPVWLVENNTRLEQLIMINCSIEGPLFLPSHPNSNFRTLDISSNKIQDEIPKNFCSVFPNLRVLVMSGNNFKSNIPHCLGGMRSLSRLDMSHNHLFGGIPGELAMSRSLKMLKLSNNTLSGKIFPTIYRSNVLEELLLDHNNFDGELPHFSPISSVHFRTLHLSDNHLSGKLPRWLWNYTSLEVLALSNNQFEGPLPMEPCNLGNLHFLDLSQNVLSGTISSCFINLQNVLHVHLRKNKLSGPLLHAFSRSSSLVTLDLSENNLTGKITDWVDTLPPALSVLLLRENNFHGEFPLGLCKLYSLSIVDLSHNKLSGYIPSCLGNLTKLRSGKSDIHISLLGYGFFDFRLVLADMGLRIYDLMSDEELLEVYTNGLPESRMYPLSYAEEVIEFSTKSASRTYKGHILDYLSGIDLSCNKLTGQIPMELGNMTEIHSLNLSHNHLTGPIPSTFSKLKQIESLDLSYNNLNGRIPPQLIELNFLAVFTVAYNDLSGPLPDMKAQFGTFNENTYEGNPLLCGPPLKNSCTKGDSP